MLYTIHVKTKAASRRVEWIDRDTLKAWVTSAPEKGKANGELIELLSEEFKTAKSNIQIVRGLTTSLKHVEIQKQT